MKQNMTKKKTVYYLIYGKILGKQEDGIYYCFERNEWVLDNKILITDYLMGYDPCEPDDSPYKIGNLDIIDKIETRRDLYEYRKQYQGTSN